MHTNKMYTHMYALLPFTPINGRYAHTCRPDGFWLTDTNATRDKWKFSFQNNGCVTGLASFDIVRCSNCNSQVQPWFGWFNSTNLLYFMCVCVCILNEGICHIKNNSKFLNSVYTGSPCMPEGKQCNSSNRMTMSTSTMTTTTMTRMILLINHIQSN